MIVGGKGCRDSSDGTASLGRTQCREALARVIAEKSNLQVDVLFGGPVETFAAEISADVFEPYKPPSFAKLPPCFRHADGQWIAIADDPLVFMSNDKFLKEHNLKPPASWNDLLAPAYKNMLQMADARTSGTAVTISPPSYRLSSACLGPRRLLRGERIRRWATGRIFIPMLSYIKSELDVEW